MCRGRTGASDLTRAPRVVIIMRTSVLDLLEQHRVIIDRASCGPDIARCVLLHLIEFARDHHLSIDHVVLVEGAAPGRSEFYASLGEHTDLRLGLAGQATIGEEVSTLAVKSGMHVIWYDEFNHPHDALVTCVHGQPEHPSINVVVVNLDKGQEDTYGQKIQRETSVVHKTYQMANGRYWDYP